MVGWQILSSQVSRSGWEADKRMVGQELSAYQLFISCRQESKIRFVSLT
jgi:hypothetical protein